MTEDDCSCRSNSENRASIDRTILAYCGKTRFSTEGLEDIGPLWEKPFQDQDLVASLPEGSFVFLRTNYRNNNQEIFFSPENGGLDYEVTR